MLGSSVKSCTMCGLDLSDKPRTKDTQGRYYCEACAAKAKAAAPKPATPATTPAAPASKPAAAPVVAAAAGIDPLMDQLVSKTLASPPVKEGEAAIVGSGNCPACSAAMAPGAQICLVCGYNLKTGKVMKTKVLGPAKEPKSASGSRRQLISIEIGGTGAFLICTGILGVAFALAMNSPGDTTFIALYMATFGVIGLLTLVMLVITPFRDGDFGWGVVILLSPFVPFLGFAVLYYLFAVTDRGSLKGMYLSTIVGYILAAVLVFSNKETEDSAGPRGRGVSMTEMRHIQYADADRTDPRAEEAVLTFVRPLA